MAATNVAAPPVAIAEAPSNIALIKYWGKRDEATQWPANDSLSMTLTAARTITRAHAVDAGSDRLERGSVTLSSETAPHDKGLKHLAYLRTALDLGAAPALHITTHNTFPSDCGIASSASGLAALTLAALAAWTGATSLDDLAARGFGKDRLAALARQGSGSACRSLFGGFVQWSAGAAPTEQTVAPVTVAPGLQLADVIVLISQAPKAVSSTVAHRAAWTSPLFAPRLAGIPDRLARVRAALAAGDLDRLGPLIEDEALEMHAVMLSSSPAARYFTEVTSKFLAWVRADRRLGNLPAWFTVDAGPNVHLICRDEHAAAVARRVHAAWGDLEILADRVGIGPTLTVGAHGRES